MLSPKNASRFAMGSLPAPELPFPSQPAGEAKGKMHMADVREAEGRPDSALSRRLISWLWDACARPRDFLVPTLPLPQVPPCPRPIGPTEGLGNRGLKHSQESR